MYGDSLYNQGPLNCPSPMYNVNRYLLTVKDDSTLKTQNDNVISVYVYFCNRDILGLNSSSLR